MNQKSVHANPNKNRTPRHRAREFALQGLYQWLLNYEAAGAIDAHIRAAHGFDKTNTKQNNTQKQNTNKQAPELRASLAPLIDRPLTQLSPDEQAAKQNRAFELNNHIEIPYRVV